MYLHLIQLSWNYIVDLDKLERLSGKGCQICEIGLCINNEK